MDLPSSASSQAQKRAVPLVCNICSKKPNFSDLSHLLTHIGSKAHLSTYYKIKVRSAADEASRNIIEEYDIWYAENDIEAFMSDRMTQKEERKRPNIKTEARSSRKAVKKETDSPTVTSISDAYVDPSSIYSHPYAAYAPMYSWAGHPYLYPPIPPKQEEAIFGEEDEAHSSDTSLMPRKRKIKDETPHGEQGDVDDANKLKGAFWPGMGLFDAATPELKKKRNQKKDISVNERLLATSEEIQQNELIFSPSGSLRKIRTISGHPEPEDDLLPGEELPPKPAKAKRAPRRKPLKTEDVKTEDTDKQPAARPRAKKRSRRKQPVAANPDAEGGGKVKDKPTHTTGRSKRKKVAVQQDDDKVEDNKMDLTEATLEQPVAMAHLTSGYQQAPMYMPAAPMGFRPAEPTYMAPQSYYQFPAGHVNPFHYDPSPMAAWDYFGYGVGTSIMNPLFSGQDAGSFGDDDEYEDNEGTISAPNSDSV